MFTYKKLIIFVFIILNILIFIRIGLPQIITGDKGLLDFEAYYLLTKQARMGMNIYGVNNMQTFGPPSTLLYYFPFSYLNINFAIILTTFLNIIAGYVSVYLIVKKTFNKNKLLNFLTLSLLFFSSFPARFSLEQGQPNMIIMFLITLLVFGYEKYKPISIALINIIKVNFAFMYLTLFKNKRIFFEGIVVFLLIITVGMFLISPVNYAYYFQERLPLIFTGFGKSAGLDYYNQSLISTLYRLNLANSSLLIYFIVVITSMAYVLKTKSVFLAVIFSLILSPVSWQHYYAILFPLIIAVYTKVPLTISNLIVLASITFFWWIEFPFLHYRPQTLYYGLIASHYFLSGLLLTPYYRYLGPD